MGTFYGTGEIVELEEESDHESTFAKPVKKFYIEDEINRLFDSLKVSRASNLPHLCKKSMKRPIKVGPYQPVSLKQALRGLSISQASEMAATKRLSKPSGFSQAVESGPVKTSHNSNNQNGLFTGRKTSTTEMGHTRNLNLNLNLKLKLSSLATRARKKLPVNESTIQENYQKPELGSSSSHPGSRAGLGPCMNMGIKDGSSSMDSSASKPTLITDIKRRRNIINKSNEKKGEFSQSSKSSVGECSSSTSFSCESNLSGLRASRPHKSKDSRWEAIKSYGKNLTLRDFKLIKKLGGGDIGTVYLAELIGSNCFFALKVLDNGLLDVRKKAIRAQTEREILQLLDHPFLPTLFLQFTTDKYLCLVIEYCPGGDLHVLRQKQPNKCFSEQAARFYVAETLLALEYLHMLGIIYRDLKPENILVREDGHIMLTDFDLSLRCNPNPTLLKPSSPPTDRPKPTEPSCIDPFLPCLTPRLPKPDPPVINPTPQVVVEPTSARSNSFVGTHEYLAPEIIKSDGHGSQVDWWTFGILLYELLYGKTPFKGTTDDDTLANVVSQGLQFPDSPIVSYQARDLIRVLLKKRPENRLGSVNGATEIRRHPFFDGLNWALIRCAVPPEVPGVGEVRVLGLKNLEKEVKVVDMF